jgi:hypothetical protein
MGTGSSPAKVALPVTKKRAVGTEGPAKIAAAQQKR